VDADREVLSEVGVDWWIDLLIDWLIEL
jgi:hypothetical protein